MSATRHNEHSRSDRVDRWLTIAAVIALVYTLAMFGIGWTSAAFDADRTLASWVGRMGSLAVIAGVLQYQHAVGIVLRDRRGERMTPVRAWHGRIAPWMIALGLVGIVAGFALGVVGL